MKIDWVSSIISFFVKYTSGSFQLQANRARTPLFSLERLPMCLLLLKNKRSLKVQYYIEMSVI